MPDKRGRLSLLCSSGFCKRLQILSKVYTISGYLSIPQHVLFFLRQKIVFLFSPHTKSCQALSPCLHVPILRASVCTDYACSWESGEAPGLHLLCFQITETCVRDEFCQILHAAPSSVKSRSLAHSFLLMLEISNNQTPSRLEHTCNFREPLTLEGSGQMVHHQSREHHIERLIGERELL